MEDKYIPKHLRSSSTASMCDCTGLIPSLPDDNFEEEEYLDLYPTPSEEELI